ncbi:hypothetical protein GQ607_004673 [Colletotrichum asianum]|uniref:Uncharacterized protein n=1 Tax=Colletotrichum asianum TaxID=702518 RepID=A0A8H3ZQN4_9PEZI|nr:hypothetical protein GQ607_004673 [Colletotrichum asianum]
MQTHNPKTPRSSNNPHCQRLTANKDHLTTHQPVREPADKNPLPASPRPSLAKADPMAPSAPVEPPLPVPRSRVPARTRNVLRGGAARILKMESVTPQMRASARLPRQAFFPYLSWRERQKL